MVDYIGDYLDNIRSRRVFPNVSPGYMREMVPDTAPECGEKWEDIFKDVERVIMPGVNTDTILLHIYLLTVTNTNTNNFILYQITNNKKH